MDHSNAWPRCPSPSPGACPSSRPLNQMPSNHLVSWHPLLLLPSIFPRIRVFSNLKWEVAWGPAFHGLSRSLTTAWEPLFGATDKTSSQPIKCGSHPGQFIIFSIYPANRNQFFLTFSVFFPSAKVIPVF